MDQMASSLGDKQALMAMSCQPAEVEPEVPIPAHLKFWGLDSGLHHSQLSFALVAIQVCTVCNSSLHVNFALFATEVCSACSLHAIITVHASAYSSILCLTASMHISHRLSCTYHVGFPLPFFSFLCVVLSVLFCSQSLIGMCMGIQGCGIA